MEEKRLYEIDREKFNKQFETIHNFVGCHLQKEMNAIHAHWVKPFLTTPSFEHLSFAYKNKIFCVLINIYDESTQHFSLTDGAVSLLIKECEKNDLVPCVFPVKINDMQMPDFKTLSAFEQGWNLIHAVTKEAVDVFALGTDVPTPMSEWELHDFAIQIVRDYIKDSLKYEVLSYQNVIGIDPQIWFKDDQGKMSWVVIRHYIYPEITPKKELTKDYLKKLTEQSNESGKAVFQGYIAYVGFYGLWQCGEGKIMRGEPNHVRFTGIEKI